MAKTLELAIERALGLPEAEQELLGRELLDRIDALDRVRDELEADLKAAARENAQAFEIDSLIAQVPDPEEPVHRHDDDWAAIQNALDQARDDAIAGDPAKPSS